MVAKLTSSASPYPLFVYPPLSLGRHTHFLTQACRNQASSTIPIFLSFILHPTPSLTWSLTGACHPSLLHIPIKTTPQALISIQPIPILHATHNHVLLYPDVSHPEFFSADIPLGCLASGIPSGQHSTLSGCLTSRILPRRHSTRMPHIRNSVRPTFLLFFFILRALS